MPAVTETYFTFIFLHAAVISSFLLSCDLNYTRLEKQRSRTRCKRSSFGGNPPTINHNPAYDMAWHGCWSTQRHRNQPFVCSVPLMSTTHLLASAHSDVPVCTESFASLSICRKLLGKQKMGHKRQEPDIFRQRSRCIFGSNGRWQELSLLAI
jgi:hypothetical protein